MPRSSGRRSKQAGSVSSLLLRFLLGADPSACAEALAEREDAATLFGDGLDPVRVGAGVDSRLAQLRHLVDNQPKCSDAHLLRSRYRFMLLHRIDHLRIQAWPARAGQLVEQRGMS